MARQFAELARQARPDLLAPANLPDSLLEALCVEADRFLRGKGRFERRAAVATLALGEAGTAMDAHRRVETYSRRVLAERAGRHLLH